MRNIANCELLIEAIEQAPGMPEGERRFALAFTQFVFRIMDHLISLGMDGEAAARRALVMIGEAQEKRRKSIMGFRLPSAMLAR
jgi:hypothetical protein